ncbi:hypothetical protein BQ8482_111608 [Mesorhizobium delmotii]|uniref:Uncharacterized protein n=1 Tax=Mesorhizobium delmotii TaxID=1631247 RepID=A0A2P9AEY7_9HYPH|nr:hypothetical protein BQ8482_111608 [Mesorhizobium delmotii]
MTEKYPPDSKLSNTDSLSNPVYSIGSRTL